MKALSLESIRYDMDAWYVQHNQSERTIKINFTAHNFCLFRRCKRDDLNYRDGLAEYIFTLSPYVSFEISLLESLVLNVVGLMSFSSIEFKVYADSLSVWLVPKDTAKEKQLFTTITKRVIDADNVLDVMKHFRELGFLTTYFDKYNSPDVFTVELDTHDFEIK